jgi:hypothetical protein
MTRHERLSVEDGLLDVGCVEVDKLVLDGDGPPWTGVERGEKAGEASRPLGLSTVEGP